MCPGPQPAGLDRQLLAIRHDRDNLPWCIARRNSHNHLLGWPEALAAAAVASAVAIIPAAARPGGCICLLYCCCCLVLLLLRLVLLLLWILLWRILLWRMALGWAICCLLLMLRVILLRIDAAHRFNRPLPLHSQICVCVCVFIRWCQRELGGLPGAVSGRGTARNTASQGRARP